MGKIYGLLVLLSGLIVVGYSLTLIAIAKVAVAVLLAVAPIFILMLVFTNTKALFEGWLRALINFALIPIFVYALLALMLVIAYKPLDMISEVSQEEGKVLSYAAPFILTCIVTVGVLRQVTSIAASIAGGVALQTASTNRVFTKPTGAGLKWGWNKHLEARKQKKIERQEKQETDDKGR